MSGESGSRDWMVERLQVARGDPVLPESVGGRLGLRPWDRASERACCRRNSGGTRTLFLAVVGGGTLGG